MSSLLSEYESTESTEFVDSKTKKYPRHKLIRASDLQATPPNIAIAVRTFWDEIALQIGIFLSVVTGFIVAQLWYNAIDHFISKQKVDREDSLYGWSYAMIFTIVAIIIMSIWGYYVVLQRQKGN
jgi:hypothetical protein